MSRAADYIRWIHSTRWLRLRRARLSAHPLCERCQAEGRIRAATEVHHRRPVEQAATPAERERRMFAPANLQALCHDCHVRTHTEMGRSGREASKRRAAEQTAETISRFFGTEMPDGGGGVEALRQEKTF